VDRVVIERKLESLRRCLQRIREKRADAALRLETDLDLQDVLVLNLSRAVQTCVDIATHIIASRELPIPQTMGESFLRLAEGGVIDAELSQRLRRAVGFRNIAVHNYDAIDWNIVRALTGDPLEDFETFARHVVAVLEQEAP
jgi:uncharacterized protein YutE (UPF0331/DUF86 family)